MPARPTKLIGVGARLTEIIRAVAGGSRAKFARMLSEQGRTVAPNTVANWEREKAYPPLDIAYQAALLYKCSLEWLMTGKDAPRGRTFGSELDRLAIASGVQLDPDILKRRQVLIASWPFS